MANYGRTTIGASWLEFEFRRRSRKITISTDETMVKILAYVRTQGTASNGTKACLLNPVNQAIVHESSLLSGFTDTSGAWREWTITGTITAADYWLVLAADGIAGGGNTIQVAYDTVSSDSSLYQSWFPDGTATWPSLGSFVGTEDAAAGYTQDISLYLETSSGGGGGGPNVPLARRFGPQSFQRILVNL